MKKLLLIFIFFSCFASYGQQTQHLNLLKQEKSKLEEMMATFSGKNESIDRLISEGKTALKLTQPKEYEYKFIFNSAIGTGYYYKRDFKSAILSFEQAYDDAVQAKLIEKSLKPLGHLVSIYHYVGLQDKADLAAHKLKQITESTDTLKTKSDIYYNLGLYNQQQKFYYGIALSNFLKSVELHRPIVDTTRNLKKKLDYGTKLMMVAEVYLYLKQPKKALEYLEEVKPFLNLSVIVDVAAYGKFIRAYVLLNDKEAAIKYYQLLHKAAGNKPGKWSELVSSNLELSSLALRNKSYNEAKVYLDNADRQSKLDNAEILTSAVNLGYGDYYKDLKDYAQASKYYRIAEHGSAIYNKEQYASLLRSIAAVEMLSGNQADAYAYFNKYVIVSDSLNQRKISLNLAEMEARFQNENKQQKIRLLNRENEAKNIQLKQEKVTRFLLIGGAVLLLIALFSIYLNFRNKQKANLLLDKKNKQLDMLNEQLTGANETKAKLFSIIAHDLRSPVSQLFTFLKLQTSSKYISEEEKNKYQKKLMKSSSALLATMEDLLLWSKSQMEHFELDIDTVNIEQLFDDATSLMQNQAETKYLTLEVKGIAIPELESDQNLLTIVLRNLLQNAINHSFPETKILLSADFNDTGKPVISIVNHGTAISEHRIEELLFERNVKSKNSGYGLLIVKELLQKLNATLQIESNVRCTTISVIFSG